MPDAFRDMLTRARGGDSQAMEELIREYEPEIRRIARLRLGSALRPYLDSIDLVQSVHHSLMLGLRRKEYDVSTPERLMALAATLVRRKAARYWRRMQRQQRLSGERTGGSSVVDLLESLSTPEADPALVAGRNDALEDLWRRLDHLDRKVLELRLEGHTTAEVARLLELDSDVLRVRLSRMRRRLRSEGVTTDWL